MFSVGQKVKVAKLMIGGGDHVYGVRSVVSVNSRTVVLDDGTKWRAKDGYFQGSQPTRGIGRSFERRIEALPSEP